MIIKSTSSSDLASDALVRIFTSRTCGWAKRNYAALVEKGMPFALVPAKDDNGNPRDEFIEVAPLRRTPVFVHRDLVLWESVIINEYIAEQFPGPGLAFNSPREKAETRVWLHYCDTVLSPTLSKLHRATDGDERLGIIAEFESALRPLETLLNSRERKGPFWFGEELGLIDIGYGLLFDTIALAEREIPEPIALRDTAIVRWSEAIDKVRSIRDARTIHEWFFSHGEACVIYSDQEIAANA